MPRPTHGRFVAPSPSLPVPLSDYAKRSQSKVLISVLNAPRTKKVW